MNWQHLAHYMLEEGPGAALIRAASTLRARHTPLSRPAQSHPPHQTWSSWQRSQDTYGRLLEARAWWSTQPRDAKHAVVESARDALQGELECWGDVALNFKAPDGNWAWHRDPMTRHLWDPDRPSHLGWQGVQGTDIKTIWEVARFDFSLLLMRAQAIDAQTFWADAWGDVVLDWIEANPYGFGVHWANGQEIAIRGLNWLLCATNLEGLPDALFSPWCASIAEHACAVAHHHPHTCISVPNNHVVLEAVFLLHCANALPWHRDAVAWGTMAKHSLTQALETQWFDDGGYIQHAHNYHRLAVWGLIWARDALCPAQDSLLLQRIHNTLKRSLKHLHAATGLRHGNLPLYGPHDGACWPRTSLADSNDFRPVLQTLSLLVHDTPIYPAGLWDEAAAWSGCAATNSGTHVPLPYDSCTTFEDAGWSVLRKDEDTFGVLVHGPKRGMFGQDDLMHVSLAWRGHRLTLDAGSFRYTGFPEAHRWFHGAQGHCTVTVRAQGARLEAGYFSWAMVPGTKTMVPGTIPPTLRAKRTGFSASWPQESRPFHERALTQTTTGWEVEDIVEGIEEGIQGRWVLPPYGWEIEKQEDGVWHLGARHHPWGDGMDARLILEGMEVNSMALTLEQGWWSPYYGMRVKIPVLCIEVVPCRVDVGPRARWRARFVIQEV